MRVLIISQWFPPEPAKIILDLAQTIQELGHEVEVLTGFPNYPTGTLYPGYRMRFLQRETIEGVRLTRVPLYPEHSRSSIRRVLNYASFAATASIAAPLFIRKPDVVFAWGSPYTTAIPARILEITRGVPFVFDVPDLWPDTLASTGMLSPRIARIVQRFAKWVYGRATAIVAVSGSFAERIIAAGAAAEKVHTISNWADVDHYVPMGTDEEFKRELGVAGKFVVMYAGAMGRPQGLEAVIDAAALLRDDDRIRFLLAGDGTDLPLLQEKARSLALDNVKFLGHFPHTEMPRVYTLADALLVHLASTPELAMTIPQKIFAYMATGKPIVSGVVGETARIVEESRSGVTCAPGDPAAIAAAVRGLASMSASERAAMGANGRRTACESFSRTHLIGRIVEVLETAVSSTRPRR